MKKAHKWIHSLHAPPTPQDSGRYREGLAGQFCPIHPSPFLVHSFFSCELHLFRVRPQRFEAVVLARRLIEQMNDDAAVVQHNPAAFAIAFDAQPLVAEVVFELVVDLLAHRVDLPSARAGGDDKVVEDARDVAQVEDREIATAIIQSGLSGSESQFQATRSLRIYCGVGTKSRTRHISPFRDALLILLYLYCSLVAVSGVGLNRDNRATAFCHCVYLSCEACELGCFFVMH